MTCHLKGSPVPAGSGESTVCYCEVISGIDTVVFELVAGVHRAIGGHDGIRYRHCITGIEAGNYSAVAATVGEGGNGRR